MRNGPCQIIIIQEWAYVSNVLVNWDSCPTSLVIVELSFKLENIIKECPYECFKKVLACPHSVSEAGLESVRSIFLFHKLFPFY